MSIYRAAQLLSYLEIVDSQVWFKNKSTISKERQRKQILTWRLRNLHVGNKNSPRGREMLSTWRRNKTSEEMIRLHVANKKYPREDLSFPTWISSYHHIWLKGLSLPPQHFNTRAAILETVAKFKAPRLHKPHYNQALHADLWRSEQLRHQENMRWYRFIAYLCGGDCTRLYLQRAMAHASVLVCRSPCSSTDRIEVS